MMSFLIIYSAAIGFLLGIQGVTDRRNINRNALNYREVEHISNVIRGYL